MCVCVRNPGTARTILFTVFERVLVVVEARPDLEEVVDHLHVHADARVLDADAEEGALLQDVDPDGALEGELDRVPDHVEHDLRELHAVAAHDDFLVAAHLQVDVLFCDLRLVDVDEFAQDLGNGELLDLEVLEPHQVVVVLEDIVELVQHQQRISLDVQQLDRQIALLLVQNYVLWDNRRGEGRISRTRRGWRRRGEKR